MKPPPKQLPPANSKKWHSRRHHDQLGYIRVRTLDNPNWLRDIGWLMSILRTHRDRIRVEVRPEVDEAIRRLERYRHLIARNADSEADWDYFLEALDAHLVRPLFRTTPPPTDEA